jgi:hypothetical protein
LQNNLSQSPHTVSGGGVCLVGCVCKGEPNVGVKSASSHPGWALQATFLPLFRVAPVLVSDDSSSPRFHPVHDDSGSSAAEQLPKMKRRRQGTVALEDCIAVISLLARETMREEAMTTVPELYHLSGLTPVDVRVERGSGEEVAHAE